VLTIGGSELLGYPESSFLWRLRGKLASTISRLVCKRVDQVIAVSQNLASALPHGLKRPPQVIPRAVNAEFFKPMERKIARQHLKWDQEKYYVAFSDPRPHMKVKNRPLAEKVVKITSQKVSREVELAIIHQKTPEEVVLMLQAADALLVTSLHEGSPNIVKEAMACNLPVVSVNCGDVQERLEGVWPSIVCDYSPDHLSRAIKKVLEYNQRSNGREMLIKQGLDHTSTALRLITTYNNILKNS
jgi:glycosyltransferase involved in cell wall biosynthesis